MSTSSDILLYPELLSNEQLFAIICQRHLRIPNLEHMNRVELLEVFHHYCVPHGQRKYRDTGRGKLLNKARNIEVESKSFNLDSFKSNNEVNSQKHYHMERLKPPPDLLSGHIKRIKISVENEQRMVISEKENSMKRKQILNTAATKEIPPKKPRNLIAWP